MMKLFKCIKYLGFKTGIRYWYVEYKIRKNPQILADWIRNLRLQASIMPDTIERKQIHEFADLLEKSYVRLKCLPS